MLPQIEDFRLNFNPLNQTKIINSMVGHLVTHFTTANECEKCKLSVADIATKCFTPLLHELSSLSLKPISTPSCL